MHADLLATNGKYFDIKLSQDPGYIYRGQFLDSFSVDYNVGEASSKVKLRFMPYKYMEQGLSERAVTNGSTLVNSGNILASPRITLTGSGDVTINGLSLKGVDKGIVLDTEAQTCTNLNGTETVFRKMHGDFLKLQPGSNKIAWNNSNFTVKITPRWVVRI